MTKEKSKTQALIDKMRGWLEIDKYEIDEEIRKQPQLQFEISEAYVKAAARRDYLKEETKRMYAERSGVHKLKMEKAGARATEAALDAAIRTDPSYRDVVEKHIKASTEAELFLALKESFHQRSFMLRDLASLWVADYYEKSAINGNNNTQEVKAQKNRDRMAEARAKSQRAKQKD